MRRGYIYNINQLQSEEANYIHLNSGIGLKSLHSTNCYSTTWWSGHRAFHQSTVPHGGQVTTSQHSTTWWSDYHQSTQYRKVVRLPPVKRYHMVIR